MGDRSTGSNGVAAAEAPPSWGWPSLRLTSEFDSESSLFHHKASCKLFGNSLAKLKTTFYNHPSTPSTITNPCVAFVSKLFSLHYDIDEQNALLKTSIPLGSNLRVTTSHKFNTENEVLQAEHGEASLVAKFAQPGYGLEFFSPLPVLSLTRTTVKFPIGELSLEKNEDEDSKTNDLLSTSGILKTRFLDGLCSFQFRDESCLLRYTFKDAGVSFIPTLYIPSNTMTFAFKRQFNPSNKWSYSLNCENNTWSTVYKYKHGNEFKFKAGYDSVVRLGWASIWMGNEEGKTKTAPLKMKFQFMLQVPQDDIKAASLMFRVKKRWDI